MILNTWFDVWLTSIQEIGADAVKFIPVLALAIFLFIVGWIVGSALSKIIEQFVKALRVDGLLKAAGAEEMLSRAGFKLNVGRFLGELVKWFAIIVFLIASFDVLGLNQVTAFLQGIVTGYLPQVIAAVLILLISVVIAEALRKFVVASAKAAHVKSANFLGSVTKWAIWIFAFLAALFQLGIASQFIQTLFTGAVVALALAFGLSFGLGGQQAAAGFIDKVKKEISDKD